VNLILFDASELDTPIPKSDGRIQHLLQVIRAAEGDRFDVGLADGPRGRATLLEIAEDSVRLEFDFGDGKNVPELPPVVLLCSHVRPAAAGRILREVTTVGVSAMHFFVADKAEKSYAGSRIWKDEEYKRPLREGAEQAFCTRIPEVRLHDRLDDALELLPTGQWLACDNYEAEASLLGTVQAAPPVVVAIGPERGWSARERGLFRERDFSLVHLGSRVLRADTAAIVAVSQIVAKLDSS